MLRLPLPAPAGPSRCSGAVVAEPLACIRGLRVSNRGGIVRPQLLFCRAGGRDRVHGRRVALGEAVRVGSWDVWAISSLIFDFLTMFQ